MFRVLVFLATLCLLIPAARCLASPSDEEALLIECIRLSREILERQNRILEITDRLSIGGAGAAAKNDAVLDLDIVQLQWPIAVRRALVKHDIKKVKDLVNLSREDLLQMDGVGPGTIFKVRQALARLGLALRDEQVLNRCLSPMEKRIEPLPSLPRVNSPRSEEYDLREEDILFLDWPPAARRAFRSLNLIKIKDLLDCDRNDLLAIRGLGDANLAKIRETLAIHGLTLRGENLP
jgi:DNA-directed RNA polymerase alpha subunit